jgi:hypothetical protein
MKQVTSRLALRNIASCTHAGWLETAEGDVRRLMIVASGYEARATEWADETIKRMPPSHKATYLVIGFRDLPQALSRPRNDRFYHDQNLEQTLYASDERDRLLGYLRERVGAFLVDSESAPIEVHIDYSCMPRLWYCNLPLLLEESLRECDRGYFWYTPGEYPNSDYPTAGVEDFHVFSGKPSLSFGVRTHLFGLGFDRVRSQAIWSIIDPQRLVCFYADPAAKAEYVNRVKMDNKNVLAAASQTFTVPIEDFVFTYSRIAAIAMEYRAFGDVILVPDGPKPLILAASLVPLRLTAPGVTCFHVARRKPEDFNPVDVKPCGKPVGFSFEGLAQTEKGHSEEVMG